MIKTLAAAAVLSFGLAGYAVAQETAPGSPAGTASVNAEPPMEGHHHHHHHHYVHHHHHHHHHHMDHAAPMAAPAPAPAQ